jgi:signal transduction histidine kinase
MRNLRQYVVAVTAAIVSALVTLVVVAVPEIDLAYRKPALHVALETAATLIALLASFLVFGRFLRHPALRSLLLVCALASLAGANVMAALEAAIGGVGRFATWAPVGTRVVGSAFFVGAAFAPAIEIKRPRRTAARALAALALVLASIAVAVASAGSRLPIGVETAPAGDPGRPDLNGHPIVLAVQLVTMVLFASAAIGFSVRFAKTGDRLMEWLAVGAVFASFARINYFLYPSLYTDWVYTGDAFRLLFYGTLLAGAAWEIRSYWQGAAASAVVAERRRIARDLHDGAAQELAFVVRRLRGLEGLAAEKLTPIVAAAERGLDDARHAIEALSRPLDEPLDVALARAVRHVASRSGIPLELEFASDVHVRPDIRDGLIRIACEAVNNAAAHSGADVVRVRLMNGRGVVLSVDDEGSGFDIEQVVRSTHRGFGLASMRQRAESFGGRFTITTAPGAGTRIEVELA